MQIEVPRGKYILAVSGGVDSMSLLDILAKKPGIKLIIAHFNHGIRPEAAADEDLVQAQAASYGIVLEPGHGTLGPNASEATARDARYKFLYKIQKQHKAQAVITAHHQDDLIETAFINIIRGTGRKGLSSILSNGQVIRPLLNTSKSEILNYARQNKLRWNDDATNEDDRYLRNYLRLKVLPRLSPSQRQTLISNLDKVAKNNIKFDKELATLSQIINSNNQIDRRLFAALPSNISNELMAYSLRQAGIVDFDRKTVSQLSTSLKTSKPNTLAPIKQGNYLKLGLKTAWFVTP